MTDTPADNTPSVIERTRPIFVGEPIVAAHFVGDTPVFVLAEEALLFIGKGGNPRIGVHSGGILESASNGKQIVTAGDDGKVMLTDAFGATTEIAVDAKRRWVDHVALAPDGAVAWSVGKQAFARAAKGDEKSIELPSSVGGLAFAPKGYRLAIAHYNGASLWFPNVVAKPEFREWKGSHVGVMFSPDGKFLVTSMQEPTLHGWRLADDKHMRMSGYGAKVKSLSWTMGGKWLATSGSTQLILWPFGSKDGPMGKQPQLLAPRDCKVVAVAAHPNQDVVAVGFEDGMIVLVRIGDGAEVLARRPKEAPVSALAWNATGAMLMFGTEDGEAGTLDLT